MGNDEIVGGFVLNEKLKFEEAFANTKLPLLPDYNKIEALLMLVHNEIPWLKYE